MRVERSTNTSSDHHLVMTTLKLHLKRCTAQGNPSAYYNVDHLKDKETADRYRLKLCNRFQVLHELYEDSATDLGIKWEHAKQMWIGACEEVVGRKNTKHKAWITPTTLTKIQTRKEKKGPERQSDQGSKGKGLATVQRGPQRGEEKHKNGQERLHWQPGKTGRRSRSAEKHERPVRHHQEVGWKIPTDRQASQGKGRKAFYHGPGANRWDEHFSEPMNGPAPPRSMPPIPPPPPPRTLRLRRLLSWKSLTISSRSAPASREILYSLFEKIWKEDELPRDWKEGLIIKLPKKGDLRDCKNYRRIMLLLSSYSVKYWPPVNYTCF